MFFPQSSQVSRHSQITVIFLQCVKFGGELEIRKMVPTKPSYLPLFYASDLIQRPPVGAIFLINTTRELHSGTSFDLTLFKVYV